MLTLIYSFPLSVSGHLRTTVGKVNLLLSQKFVQFRGLCADCIATSERANAGKEEGEFVTLPSDLEGFWAMVMLQVDDLRSMIASCDRLRESGWKMDPDVASNTNGKGTNISTVSSLIVDFCILGICLRTLYRLRNSGVWPLNLLRKPKFDVTSLSSALGFSRFLSVWGFDSVVIGQCASGPVIERSLTERVL